MLDKPGVTGYPHFRLEERIVRTTMNHIENHTVCPTARGRLAALRADRTWEPCSPEYACLRQPALGNDSRLAPRGISL